MNAESSASPALAAAAPRRFTRLDAISLSFFAAVLALSIFTAVTPREDFRPHGHLMAALTVFFYGVLAWWRTRNDAALSFRLGETLYLLGYVATICGIGAIAWQIGQDPTLLSGPKIPTVLARGSLALLSTVIGLIGMNYLRSHSQSLDLQRGQTDREARQFAEQMEQVLRKTEEERAKTFLHAFQAADLTQQLMTLVANLKAASEGLAAFRTDASQVKQTWTDTLAGLAGLNSTLRQFQDVAAGLNAALAGLGGGISEAANLAQAARNTTAAVSELGAAVSQLQQTAATLNTGLAPVQAGLAGFRTDAEQAMQSWAAVQTGLADLNGALRQFKELADGLAASWGALAQELQQTPPLGQAASSATASLDQLGMAVGRLNTTIEAVHTGLSPLRSDLVNAVRILQDRLEKLPALADAVARFVDLANRVAPTMEVLGGTFSDIRNINENLRLAAGGLQTLTGQLTAANKATGSVADNADKLMKSTDTLVAEVANQVHRLAGISEDMQKIGQAVQKLAPGMESPERELATIQQFSARIAELVKTLGQAQETLASTTTKLHEVPTVVKDFMETTRKLLVEAREGQPPSR